MSIYAIQDKDFLMKQEQYHDMIHEARRARMAGEAKRRPARPAGWHTAARLVAGAALAGLLLTVAANAHAAAFPGAINAAAAAGRPSVVAGHEAEPAVDRDPASAAEQPTAYEQRMLVKESHLDPSAPPIRSRPILAAAGRTPGPTAREKYLALKLSQLE